MTELLVERAGGVATLTMNRPETRNALNQPLLAALRETCEGLDDDPEIRAVVLTGAGAGFCSGADLKAAMAESNPPSNEERIERFHAIIRAIVNSKKPFVAALNGGAVGFGADLALACDLRVMSTEAYIQEKFVKIGLMPDGGGTFWLPRLVGIGRALEFMLLGTKIDSAQAEQLGLTNRVAAPGDLMAVAEELARELAGGPPLAFAEIKAATRASWTGTALDALDREKEAQSRLLSTEDMGEGVTAWAQRRAPVFKGK